MPAGTYAAGSLVTLALAGAAFVARRIQTGAAFHVAGYPTLHVFIGCYVRLAGLAWQATAHRPVVFDRARMLRLLRRLVADFGVSVWASLGVVLATFSRLLRHSRR